MQIEIKGINWMLVDGQGKEVNVGDVIESFRGETHKCTGGMPPQRPESTGRVYVGEGKTLSSFYPNVFNLKWIIV